MFKKAFISLLTLVLIGVLNPPITEQDGQDEQDHEEMEIGREGLEMHEEPDGG